MRDAFKIHMCGQIRRAGGGHCIGGFMGFQRLECVAKGAPIAIVYDQCRPAVGVNACGNLIADRGQCWAKLHQIAVFGVAQSVIKGGVGQGGGQTQGELAIGLAHLPFAPKIPFADELADGKGIEKLVCDQKQGVIGQGSHCVVVGDLQGGKAGGLHAAQMRRGFHQMHLGCTVKPWHPPRGAQDIRHQGAAAGAEFGQGKLCWRALIHPGLRQGQSQHLAKHLADLWCCDEIARCAKRVAGRVIAMFGMHQAIGHILGQCDWAGFGDAPQQKVGEGVVIHAFGSFTGVPLGLDRSAQISVSAPIIIIGRVRVCPMVMPNCPTRITWPHGLSGVMN